MAVYQYVAVAVNKHGHTEHGTILARDKLDAFDKLKGRDLTDISLKRVRGWSAFLGKLTATIR